MKYLGWWWRNETLIDLWREQRGGIVTSRQPWPGNPPPTSRVAPQPPTPPKDAAGGGRS